MTPATFLDFILDRGLALTHHCGGPCPDNDVRCFLLAVALQESGINLDARYQASPAPSPGPARGWWQFEEHGGVAGVLGHTSSQALAKEVCQTMVVVPEPAAVWRSIEGNGPLAAAFARLLLLTDPTPVPTTSPMAWDCYLRLWRPGSPHPETWENNWQTADAAVKANPYSKLNEQ